MFKKLALFLSGLVLVLGLVAPASAASPKLETKILDIKPIKSDTAYTIIWQYTITNFDKSAGWKLRMIGNKAKVITTITPTSASKKVTTEVSKIDAPANLMVFQIIDKKGAILATATASTGLASTPGSSAQPGCAQTTAYTFCNTLFGDVTAGQYFQRFYSWAVAIAIIGASLMIIYAGYKYTMSRGNPSEVSNAKEIIYSTLLGVVLLVLSYSILRFLGINLR